MRRHGSDYALWRPRLISDCTHADLDFGRDDEELFYRLLLSHTEEILPFVYTPTVGEACENYHNLPIKPRGLYLRATDSGNFLKRLQEWPQQDIRYSPPSSSSFGVRSLACRTARLDEARQSVRKVYVCTYMFCGTEFTPHLTACVDRLQEKYRKLTEYCSTALHEKEEETTSV